MLNFDAQGYFWETKLDEGVKAWMSKYSPSQVTREMFREIVKGIVEPDNEYE
jgi:hypothetical protein